MSSHALTRSSTSSNGLRRGRLGAGTIAFFVVAAVAPLAGLAGAAPVVFASNGPAAPATFILAGLLFAVFSVGYVAMSRQTSNAGGFVAYIARGLGTRAGGAAAWVTVLTYLAVQCALWSQYAVFAQVMFADTLGLDLPAPVWLYLTLALGTLIVCRGIELSLKVAGTLLALEILVIAIFVVVVIATGGAGGDPTAGFAPKDIFGPGLGIAFLFSVSAFVGFEATVIFSEEARDPHRTVPRAIIISIAVIAGIYALTTWALSRAWGPESIQDAAIADPGALLLGQAESQAGAWLGTSMEILIVTSFIASLVGFHNMFARLLFSLGRAGVLPSALGVTTGEAGVPARAAVTIGASVALVVGGFLLGGADLITVVFSWLLALGTVGLVSILVATSAAIILFFARERTGASVWVSAITPAVAFAGFLMVAYLAIRNYDLLLGGQGGFARWLLLLLPVAAIGGWLVATRRRLAVDFAADLG